MEFGQAFERSTIFLRTIFENYGLNLSVAIIILLVGLIIGKLVGKLIKRVLHEIEVDKILKKATRVDAHLEKILSVGVTYFIYFITIIMVFNQLNITTTVLQMISAAVILIVVISIVLAIKDFIPNLFAGFYILKNRFIVVGEIIRIKGMEGEVLQITLLETKLETKEGDTVYIPNSAITRTEVIKVSEVKTAKKKK